MFVRDVSSKISQTTVFSVEEIFLNNNCSLCLVPAINFKTVSFKYTLPLLGYDVTHMTILKGQ